MTDERDAPEILSNLLYLIEHNAHDADTVVNFTHQAAGPVEYLVEHCTDKAPQETDVA